MAGTHVANVSAKAGRFIDFLLELVPLEVLDLDQMRVWGDAEWQRVAELLNERNGTSETMPKTSRSAIIVGLREHHRAAVDPFAGLPS
jgi:hypothetical protein